MWINASELWFGVWVQLHEVLSYREQEGCEGNDGAGG